MVSKKHSRRQYSSEEKAKIVKRHLVGNEDVSDISLSVKSTKGSPGRHCTNNKNA